MSDDAPSNIQDVDAGTPPPSGYEVATTAGLHQMAKDDDASDYVAEKRDQKAESDGADIPADRKAARAERYQRAVKSAVEHVSEHHNASAPESRTLAEAVGATVDGNTNHETQEQFANRVREQTRVETQFSMRAENYVRQHPEARDDCVMLEYYQPAPHVNEIIIKSEYGPQLAHELAKNFEAVLELNELPPVEAARVLGVVEGRLRSEEAQARQAQPSGHRRATSAPTPMSTVRGGASPPTDLYALAKNDDGTAYITARRAQQKASAR